MLENSKSKVLSCHPCQTAEGQDIGYRCLNTWQKAERKDWFYLFVVLEGFSPSRQGDPVGGLTDGSRRCGRLYSYHSGRGTETHRRSLWIMQPGPITTGRCHVGECIIYFSCHGGQIPDRSNVKKKGFIWNHCFRGSSPQWRGRHSNRGNSNRLRLHHSGGSS